MADLSTINAIVKHRYNTGEYGAAHFITARDVLDAMRQHTPTPPPGTYAPPRLPGYSIGDLMGIPVLVDDGLPEGTWRLVDGQTGAVIHEGTILQCCDMHGRNCEPPSELCCARCTEAAHDMFPIRHADGSVCSAPDLSRTTIPANPKD